MGEPQALLNGLIIRCPNIPRDIHVRRDDVDFYSDSHECDMCGSHGEITATVKCECGDYHEISLYSW